MKRYKLLLIFFSVLLATSCSSGPAPVFTNGIQRDSASYKDAESSEYQKKVFSSFCQNGRQVKKLSYSIRFIKPKFPKKIALDKTAALLEELSDVKQCLMKTSSIQLSQHCNDFNNCHIFYSSSDSSSSIAQYAKEMLYDDSTSEFCQMGYCTESGPMRPVFIFLGQQQPIYLFFEKTERKSSSHRWGNWYASKYGDDSGERQAFFIELNALRQGYVILVTQSVPEEKWMDRVGFQNDICTKEKLSMASYKHLAESLPIDNRTLTPSEALSNKELIWKRYLLLNSTIKEAVSGDPQIVNYEISIDLNNFCTFGRHADDVTSF